MYNERLYLFILLYTPLLALIINPPPSLTLFILHYTPYTHYPLTPFYLPYSLLTPLTPYLTPSLTPCLQHSLTTCLPTLHHPQEQQTLSIAKAGIICTMNARTSVLAAANPIGSQWDKNKTIVENIQLQHTLLSRFLY